MPPALCYDCEFSGLDTPCRAAAGRRDYEAMAQAYLNYWNARMQEQEPGRSDRWITDCVFELEQNDPRAALVFVLFALERIRSAQMLAVHAAGPIENILSRSGPEIIDTVEIAARASRKFRLLLSGVWGSNRMSADVWSRVCSAVAAGPIFCDDFRTPGHDSGVDIASDFEIARLLESSVFADLGGRQAVEALAAPGTAPSLPS